MLIIALICSYLINTVCSYTITFPTLRRNYAVVTNVNIKQISDYEKTEFIKLFNSVPLIMFKNQKINPIEYYEFCKLFDDKHNNEVIHPFEYSKVDIVPQIALRGNCYIKDLHGIKDTYLKYSDPFKNTLVIFLLINKLHLFKAIIPISNKHFLILFIFNPAVIFVNNDKFFRYPIEAPSGLSKGHIIPHCCECNL